MVEWAGLYRREVASALAGLALATQAVARQGDSSVPLHILRTIIPITQEALAAYSSRPGTNRHNPYGKPGYLEKVGRPHAEAFDCTGATASSGAPPCTEQGAFEFRGERGSYPRVRRDRP